MPEPQEGQSAQGTGAAANMPLNPDLMGYPTVEALVNAKRASDQEAKRIYDENVGLKGQLHSVYHAPVNPRQDIPQRASPSDRLTEFGVPVDALDQYFEAKLQSAFAPIAAGLTARTTLLGQYPDYNKFEADVAQFVQADPNLNQTYQRMFAADPAGAFEYAFLKFGESRRRSTTAASDISAEAAAHAGIPSSRSGEARRTDQGASGEIQRAWEAYQRNDTPATRTAYAKARLHTVITDDFLNT